MNTLNQSALQAKSDGSPSGDNHAIDHRRDEILELSLDEMAYVAGGAQSFVKWLK